MIERVINFVYRFKKECRTHAYQLGSRVVLIPGSNYWGRCIDWKGDKVLDVGWFRVYLTNPQVRETEYWKARAEQLAGLLVTKSQQLSTLTTHDGVTEVEGF